MSPHSRPHRRTFISLHFGLLLALFAALWIAGGASRPDAFGQVVVRVAAAAVLLVAVVLGDLPKDPIPRPVLYILAAAVVLVLVQLLPLPPAMWQSLPSRALFSQVMTGEQPWRPLSVEPGATVNAAASLLVPAAVLVLVVCVRQAESHLMSTILLGLVAASALLGLVQLSGTPFDNPLVNDTPGAVSALFANRNHFALFLAMGCLIAPVWASQGGRQASWRIPVALGLIAFFLLLILASGSRAGVVVGVIGGALGLATARRDMWRTLNWMPKWLRLAIVVVVVVAIVALVVFSITSDRAQSVNRMMALSSNDDMRTRALPTLFTMVGAFFPFGAGFGSFDTVFRMYEPFDLLKLTYFNHAHDDFLELVIDGGIPALILLVAALGWWVVASIRVWRQPVSSRVIQGRLGSALLLLLVIASAFDYPARTPLMMAIIVLAAVWLGRGSMASAQAALPADGLHL